MLVAKQYELEIENWGNDVYIVASKGHHDPDKFMEKVRGEGFDWPLGNPQHLYFKAIPRNDGCQGCLFVEATKETRGSFPVTYASEAYGDDQYKAPLGRIE